MIIRSKIFKIFIILPLKFYNDCLKSYNHQVILLSSPVHICTYMCSFPPVPCFIMALVISMGLKQCYCIKTKLSA